MVCVGKVSNYLSEKSKNKVKQSDPIAKNNNMISAFANIHGLVSKHQVKG